MKQLIKRDRHLQRLIDKKENGLIKVITGIRRCGKSKLLFELYYDWLLQNGINNNHIITIALDTVEGRIYRDPDIMYGYVKSLITDNDMYYILIDEVQYAISEKEMKGKEEIRLYNTLNSLMRLRNVDIYVTGSNSKRLTKDVLTAFRGRGDQVHIWPLSFSEYYEYVGGDKSEAFENYSLFGGLPQTVYLTTDSDKTEYLTNLFTETYFKDITERYTVGLPNVLEGLTDDLCSSIGSLTNASKIKKTLKSVQNIDVSSNTISDYLEFLIESFLFTKAQRYAIKGKQYFSYPNKYYCVDIGLRNARLKFRQQEETHIMENVIFNELLYRGYSVDIGIVNIVETIDGKRTKKAVRNRFCR